MFGIELFRKLLSNCRATSSAFLTKKTTFNNSTSQSIEINTRVLIETCIFGSNKSLDKPRRQFGIVYQYTVLAIIVPCTDDFPICRIYLSCITTDWVLQIFNRRHITNPAFINSIKGDSTRNNSYKQQSPQEIDK